MNDFEKMNFESSEMAENLGEDVRFDDISKVDILESMPNIDRLMETSTDKQAISLNEFDWALGNMSKAELVQFRDAIKNEDILVELDEDMDGTDAGPVRIRKR